MREARRAAARAVNLVAHIRVGSSKMRITLCLKTTDLMKMKALPNNQIVQMKNQEVMTKMARSQQVAQKESLMKNLRTKYQESMISQTCFKKINQIKKCR